MNISASLRCPVVLLSLILPPQAIASADIVGEAFALESGSLLYREHHFCKDSASKCSIEYRDQDDQVFARKDLDYSINVLAPTLQFSDLRLSQHVSVDLSESVDLVVDAGFDNFVRSRWNDLSVGEPVDFEFKIVGREAPLKMVAHNKPEADCGMNSLCLEVRLNSWLLRRFVDPIRLTYDRDTRRLMRYQGISNIRAVDGGSLNVDIIYQYGTDLDPWPGRD